MPTCAVAHAACTRRRLSSRSKMDLRSHAWNHACAGHSAPKKASTSARRSVQSKPSSAERFARCPAIRATRVSSDPHEAQRGLPCRIAKDVRRPRPVVDFARRARASTCIRRPHSTVAPCMHTPARRPRAPADEELPRVREIPRRDADHTPWTHTPRVAAADFQARGTATPRRRDRPPELREADRFVPRDSAADTRATM